MASGIDLSEAEVIAAQLAALGVAAKHTGKSPEERTYEALVELIKAKGDYVTSREIAERVGVAPNTVTNILHRLVLKGRAFATINERTGKACFVPKVV